MRLAKWDNLKFFLIYCVVLGHLIANVTCDSSLLKGLYLFIYTFHMPAFLFISGLFSKRAINEKRIEKAMVFLVLYLFMKALRLFSAAFVEGEISGFSLFSENGVPWFALVLFFYYVITMAVNRFPDRYLLVVAVCMGMMAGYDAHLGKFLSGMRLLTFYPFFLAGYCMPIGKLSAFVKRKRVRIAAAFIIAVTFVICFAFNDQLYEKVIFLKGNIRYGKMDMMPFGGIYRGIYYAAAFVLIISVIALTPSGSTVFSKMGQRTIQVFALHYPIIEILIALQMEKYLQALMPAHYGVLVPVVALALTLLLSLPCFVPVFDWLMHPVMKDDTNK